MAKKKLQLSDIKVKSLVTVVEKGEQKTSKGGFISIHQKPTLTVSLIGRISWTEMKTQLTVSSAVSLKKMTREDNGSGARFD